MLTHLRVRDYAVLDDVSIELGPGLTALSGETGAGKSLLVGALSLLLGERATADVVRTGAQRAIVEGVFDVSGHSALGARLAELGVEPDGGLLILKREVAAEGRNRAWANGSPTTAAVVGELGSVLVDLHGQHEHQALLRPEEHGRILDAFAECAGAATEVAERADTSGELVGVFVPTTPNPTSGFLLFFPEEDVIELDMTVEDAAKLVISAGLVYPNGKDPSSPPEE